MNEPKVLDIASAILSAQAAAYSQNLPFLCEHAERFAVNSLILAEALVNSKQKTKDWTPAQKMNLVKYGVKPDESK